MVNGIVYIEDGSIVGECSFNLRAIGESYANANEIILLFGLSMLPVVLFAHGTSHQGCMRSMAPVNRT